jgi:hypothetical protein
MEKEPKLNPPEAEGIKIIDGKKYRKVFSGYTVRQYYSHQTPEKGPGPGWDFFIVRQEELAKKYGIELKNRMRFRPEDLPNEPYYEWEEVEE